MSQKHHNQIENACKQMPQQCDGTLGQTISNPTNGIDSRPPSGHQLIANEIYSMRSVINSLDSMLAKIQGSEEEKQVAGTCEPYQNYSLATLLTEAPNEMAKITSIVHDKINHINDLLF